MAKNRERQKENKRNAAAERQQESWQGDTLEARLYEHKSMMATAKIMPKEDCANLKYKNS